MTDILNIMCDAYDKAAIEHKISPKQYGKNHKCCGVAMQAALDAVLASLDDEKACFKRCVELK